MQVSYVSNRDHEEKRATQSNPLSVQRLCSMCVSFFQHALALFAQQTTTASRPVCVHVRHRSPVYIDRKWS